MSEDMVTEMKEKMSNHPVLQRKMEKLMAEWFSQDEALDIMIVAWLCHIEGD